MSDEKSPDTIKIWLGLEKSIVQQQKTVTFGDASTVVGGKIWGILSVALLAVAWLVISSNELVDPIFWPSPGAVWDGLIKTMFDGFKNYYLHEHIWASLMRVLSGVLLGTLVGVPLGLAMGLSTRMRGFFDPIVEFMRPIPPLALIPLMILWFGIGEQSKIILLFLASVFIMTIAARSGVASVRISKVHAAYCLGASKRQILRHVILINALPEIFTGIRTSLGVCWATVVAAELVGAKVGVGYMILAASKFLSSELVVLGIILIGIIGFLIEVLMRWAEAKLIPWQGKG
ncbi:MAG: taurine transport system permease protein [Planctomycetota bacterium]|jgi:taurine transport system permease protein